MRSLGLPVLSQVAPGYRGVFLRVPVEQRPGLARGFGGAFAMLESWVALFEISVFGLVESGWFPMVEVWLTIPVSLSANRASPCRLTWQAWSLHCATEH